MTCHARIVKSNTRDQGNPSTVVISGGFEVAPGDASDVEVTNANTWGGVQLYFGDGHYASAAIKLKNLYQNDPQRGMARVVVKRVNIFMRRAAINITGPIQISSGMEQKCGICRLIMKVFFC